MLKVWTVVGTRPEIIRLSSTIKLFDKLFDHRLIHTGQNFGATMSDVFFEDLDIREPDNYFGVEANTLGELLGRIFMEFERLLEDETPDAVVVLGDTNSALVTILARRRNITTYHLEAGNRAFDSRVPEETNRKIIDHTADFNIAYNSFSRENLLREGLDPKTVFVSGSPMLEVINSIDSKIGQSDVLERYNLEKGKFFVGSFHRQENVDDRISLTRIVDMCDGLCQHYGLPMLLSLHPRTRNKLEDFGLDFGENVLPLNPLGFVDYLALEKGGFATISDSGTLAEESAILGFVGISSREATERPEANTRGYITLASSSLENCIEAMNLALEKSDYSSPEGYEEPQFSIRVANIISSTARRRDQLLGIF